MSLSDVDYDSDAFTSLSTVEFLRLIADDTGFYKCQVTYVYQNGTATYSTTFDSEIGELYIVSFQMDLLTSSYNGEGSAVTLSVITKGPNEPKSVAWSFRKGMSMIPLNILYNLFLNILVECQRHYLLNFENIRLNIGIEYNKHDTYNIPN